MVMLVKKSSPLIEEVPFKVMFKSIKLLVFFNVWDLIPK